MGVSDHGVPRMCIECILMQLAASPQQQEASCLNQTYTMVGGEPHSTRSEAPRNSCGCSVLRAVRRSATAVFDALRHPIRTLRRCRPVSSISFVYRRVSEGSDAASTLSALDADRRETKAVSACSKVPASDDDRPKRSGSKRIKKNIRGGIKRYGETSLLSASPIGSACLARDIQQRISMNYNYVEMKEVYVPTYAVFL